MGKESHSKQTEIGPIPEDWDVSSIEDIASPEKHSLSMGPFGSNITKDNFLPHGVPVIRGNNLAEFRFLDKDFVFLSEKKADELLSSNVKAKDIIITHRGTLGQVGIIPAKSKYKRYVVSQSGMKLTCDGSRVDSEFVFYWLKSPRGQQELLKNVSQTGVPAIAQPLSSLRRVALPKPPLHEQHSIAKIFADFDLRIEVDRQENQTLEAIGQAIFKRWFVDFEFPNEEGKPYKSSGGEMVTSELGEIPKNWDVKKVGEVLQLAYGKALKETIRNPGNIPVYGSNGQIGWHNKRLVKGPGIVVGRKGNPGTVVWANTDFFPIDTTFYVVPKGSASLCYLFHVLKNQNLASLSADSAVPGLNRNMVYRNHLLVSSSTIMSQFDSIIRKLACKVQNDNEQNSTLSQLRDTLLPKLMSGKVRIPVL